MSSYDIKKRAINASKWSTVTTIATKLITPLIQMILARILMPEDFGIVAIATMVISFVQMFTDAGFQKYIIQKEFDNKQELDLACTVAFWTNMLISIIMWAILLIGAEVIANILGNIESKKVIQVAGAGIVLYALSGIQNARRQREMDFKSLFIINLITIIVPGFASIPLAFLGYGYWSIVIGNILGLLANAIVLWMLSDWKPKLYYNVTLLKQMLNFSIWSMIESFGIWLVSWVDGIIISSSFTSSELGLYRNSISLVNMITLILTSPLLPILFSTLSRLQNDEVEFNLFFKNTQKFMALLLIPSGIGILLFRETIQKIAFGVGWEKAGIIIGLWGISTCIVSLFSMTSEVYRAKGVPKTTVKVSFIHLLFLVPTCIIAGAFGFWTLVIARTLIRFQSIPMHLYYLKKNTGITAREIFNNFILPFKASSIMVIVYIILKLVMSDSYLITDLIKIIICGATYIGVVLTDKEVLMITKRMIRTKIRNIKVMN